MKLFFYFAFIIFISSLSDASIQKWTSSLPENSEFSISEDLEERVNFWIKIYSHYSTNQGVFHLVDDPEFILGEIDLSSINENSILSSSEKQKQIQKLVESTRTELIKKWKISEANTKKVRLQMGLKDRMQKALFLSGRYLPMMEKIFRQKKLPIELTRLVFVESSFNVMAQSKVGASGLWQIMPSVAKPHGYIKTHYDNRNHPVYATQLASEILKTNYAKLNSWPLAITAYNHGLTGVKRMVELNQSQDIETLVASESTTRSWGFASKNFYACFLAVLEVERNAHSLFGDHLVQSKNLKFKEFILKKPLAKKTALKLFDGSLSRFKQLNPHLNWARLNKQKKLPAGLPLIIPTENFYLVAQFKSNLTN